MKGQPSDNGYGCSGEDLMPTAAVGRFPARSIKEVEQMVRKTLSMEQESLPDSWQNRLVMVVGNPGGSNLMEKRFAEWFVQNAGQARLSQLHPSWSVLAVFHSSSSPFNVPNDRLRDATMHYLEEGQVFSFYLGHSNYSGLWSDGAFFMTREDWAKLKISRGQGVFFTCGCFACQLSGNDSEGYGLTAMRNPDGPAAVIGAHAESYAAMGQLAVDGMLKRLTAPPQAARLADYWLAVKEGLAKGEINALMFQLYDQADGSGGKIPLAVQRKEHLEMWMLLGDPAMHLPIQPLDIRLDVAGDPVSPGESIAIKGVVPDLITGTNIRITLERPIGSTPTDLEPMPDKSADTRDRVMMENHQRANNVVLVSKEVQPQGNIFECNVQMPDKLPWKNIIVRAKAATETQAAQGIAILPVRQKKK